MATTKKPAKPSHLSQSEAAELLGITEEDLMLSRMRGLEPGRSGYRKDGVLVWSRRALEAWKDEAGEEG